MYTCKLTPLVEATATRMLEFGGGQLLSLLQEKHDLVFQHSHEQSRKKSLKKFL